MIRWKIYRGLDSLYRLDIDYNSSKRLSWKGNHLKSSNLFKTIYSEKEKLNEIEMVLDTLLHKHYLTKVHNIYVAKELLDI